MSKCVSVKNLKVSVVMPVFNDERFAVDSIRSVLAQTHDNIELLIVDDCSNDNTFSLVSSFKDERIKIFRNNKNMGAAFSRNLAIANSTGDYIAFLDGDDVWKANKVESQLSFMVENNISFSYTNFLVMNEDGNEIKKRVTGPKQISHKMFLKTNYVGCLTVMFRRDIYPDLSIPVSILKRNDYALWLKLSEKADCFLLNNELSLYRKRTKSSISSQFKGGLIKYHRELFSKLYGFGRIKSNMYAIRNVYYFFIRNFFFVKAIYNQRRR